MKPLKAMDAPEIAAELVAAHPELQPAVELATNMHEGQFRAPRNGRRRPPYIEHPLRVSARLARLGADDVSLLQAAILHDVVEDCSDRLAELAGGPCCRSTSLEVLEEKFGQETAEVVDLVTNAETGGNYVEDVAHGVSEDARALIVKTSDWLDNAGSLHHTPKLAPRLSRKYRPLSEVLLVQWDRQYTDVQTLLNGNFDLMRVSILRAAYRLEVLSRSH